MNDLKFNYQIEQMRGDAARATKLAQEARQDRLVKFERAKQVRPFWLPCKLALDGTAGKQRIAYTDAQDFDLLIIGAISNFADLRLTYDTVGGGRRWSQESIPAWAATGLVGQAPGTNGVQYFPEPPRLKAGNKMAVTITNTPGHNNETVWIVFLAYKVLASTDKEGQVDTVADQEALASINSNESQRTVFLKMDVPFVSGGNVQRNRKVLEEDAPILILGMATNLANCTVRITDPAAQLWSPEEVPIWALASNYVTERGAFRALRRPFYLPAKSSPRADFTNGINGASDAIDGELVFLGVTP